MDIYKSNHIFDQLSIKKENGRYNPQIAHTEKSRSTSDSKRQFF
jgi:hypothetical protein